MLDAPPKESEVLSWSYVIVGSLIIFCTIPVARSLREMVREHIGIEYFLYFSMVLVLSAGYLGLRNLHKRRLPLDARLCLFVIFAAFLGYVYTLRAIPEEAIHVAEYGILGLLVYRALSHRIHDISIYFAAFLVVGSIGIIDEYIQWLIPSRYFDLRDIRTNFIAGALTQVGIAAGLRPRLIHGMPSKKNWSRICLFFAATLALMTLGFMNTPQRIAWYSTKISFLSYLMNSKSMMVEYGYRYDDPDIGVFRSRFSATQLKELDQKRGAEVAKILDTYIRGEGYSAFESIYTVTRDAHAHEAGVHLFSREYHMDRIRENTETQAKHYHIANRENLILAKYFSNALKSSGHYWSPEVELEITGNAPKDSSFESAVSRGVITRFTERQVLSFFAVIIIVLILLGVRLDGKTRTNWRN
ncbi:MAG: VanZ family protein [bacterium]